MIRAPLSVKLTALDAPLFDTETAPAKLLAEFNVMTLAPAVKLDVPAMLSTPLCVIDVPTVVIDNPPPKPPLTAVKVILGKTAAGLLEAL
jgi:hypothetical protein